MRTQPTAQGVRLKPKTRTNRARSGQNLEHPKVKRRLAQIPGKYRKHYVTAITGGGLRQAIISQCLECCGYVSTEVTLCTDNGCSLFPYRPYQGKGVEDA